MFCQKCGSKLEDNVVFCPKCGTKLSVAEAELPAGSPVMATGKKADEGEIPTPKQPYIYTVATACEMLQKNAALCPEIETIQKNERSSAVVVKGKFNRYTVKISDGQSGLNSFPVFPFVIPMVLCILGAVFLMVALHIYTSYRENFILPVAIFMLLSGLFGIGVSVFANKEKKAVLPFIRKTLAQPRYTEQFQHIEMLTYSIFVFCGFFFLSFGLMS